MYRWLRNTHLFIGLFSALFVLMFGVSAIRFSHKWWFSSKPKVTEQQFTIPLESSVNVGAVAEVLRDRYGLRGDIGSQQPTAEGFGFVIARQGTNYAVSFSKAAGAAKVRTSVDPFMGMLDKVHSTFGLWHEYLLLNIWGLLLGLVSLGLTVLAATGIYLWFKIHEERVVGTVLLVISLTYSFTLIYLLSTA